jgi:hypothetical protein
MNSTLKSNFPAAIPVFFLVISLFSCDSDDPAATADSFFPLAENSRWVYEYQYFFTMEGERKPPYHTKITTIRVQGDTTLEGKTYKKFVDDAGTLIKIVRQEGSRYFGRNHELYTGFSHEYMFLDTAVPPNGTWSYIKDDGASKTEYKVKALHARYNFNGNLFLNVVEVEVTYHITNDGVTLEPWLSTKHYYAKGIGEIYAYYPPPLSGVYSDLDISFVKSN